jgi:hypothetical protein
VVKVSVSDDAIILRLEGTKKFFALRSRVTIPLGNIVKVSTEQVKPLWLPSQQWIQTWMQRVSSRATQTSVNSLQSYVDAL